MRQLAVCIVSGKSVAAARDDHYHNPPDYIVLEPGDTAARTRNLQQTNTNGYKFQGTAIDLRRAEKFVTSWGENAKKYKPTSDYQLLLRQLFARYTYRLDTNFAKIDRIVHPGIERFKKEVMNTKVHGLTVEEWRGLLASEDDEAICDALATRLDIKEKDPMALVK